MKHPKINIFINKFKKVLENLEMWNSDANFIDKLSIFLLKKTSY